MSEENEIWLFYLLFDEIVIFISIFISSY